jgi:hypothetical protein
MISRAFVPPWSFALLAKPETLGPDVFYAENRNPSFALIPLLEFYDLDGIVKIVTLRCLRREADKGENPQITRIPAANNAS